ncbi:hypothetical protein [Okeania sp. SIO2C2]|nr:hypothetical protein [Okeania sp. SIO2C2]
MDRNKSYLETGISNLDSELYGGFFCDKLTSIKGRVAVDKTTFIV